MKGTKKAKAGARGASHAVNDSVRAVKGEVRRLGKSAKTSADVLERHDDKLAEAMKRIVELEAKVKKMATDPVVMVPHETKRRVEVLEARTSAIEQRFAERLTEKAAQAALDRLDTRVEQLEGYHASHQETLDNHEDRLDTLEDRATEPVNTTPAEGASDQPKCRCIPELKGKDPDCYVHGSSFDATDRPSTTKAMPGKPVESPDGDGASAPTRNDGAAVSER